MTQERELPTLDQATTRELLKEFMTRGCHERRSAVRDELDIDDAEVVMEIFGLVEESGYSSEVVDNAHQEGA